MKYCTRESILKAMDYDIRQVETPEWGGITCVKTFSAKVRSDLLKDYKNDEMPPDWMEKVIVASACDADGNLLFQRDDIKKLSNKSASVLERVFVAAIELNGLTEKAADEIKGESEPIPK